MRELWPVVCRNVLLPPMGIRYAIGMLLALASMSALADWQMRHSSSDAEGYLDPATVRRVAGQSQIWFLSNFRQPTKFGSSSLRILLESDCALGRQRWLRTIEYSGPMGTGKTLSTSSSPEGWYNVSPGSAFESVLKFVCNEQ
jgi:hypothetical protein